MFAKAAYYLVVLPLSYLPLPVLYVFTDIFYLLLVTFVPYRKNVVHANIARSFPNLSLEERKRIERRFYRHFTDLLAEGVKNLTISEKRLRKRFRVRNPELMDLLHRQGKSVLLVSGHYNNWEWLISAQNLLFPHQAMGIGMPMTNKFWDAKINERRSRFGMKIVHSGNFREAIEANRGTPLAILVLSDQSPGDSHKSYWMPFLHQQTPVLFGAEQMAHQYDFAVVGFVTEKVRRGYYEMTLFPIATEPNTCGWGEITEAHTRLLEQAIRREPQYWIWSHKRWKREIPQNLEALRESQKAKFEARFGNPGL